MDSQIRYCTKVLSHKIIEKIQSKTKLKKTIKKKEKNFQKKVERKKILFVVAFSKKNADTKNVGNYYKENEKKIFKGRSRLLQIFVRFGQNMGHLK